MIELPRMSLPRTSDLRIRIFGLGGAGCNVIDRLQLDGVPSNDLVALNTDLQSLTGSVAPLRVQLGPTVTRGLGAGGDPELGYAAAEESGEAIREAVGGANLVFICVGLGGGTGSGAAPMVAAYAREQKALVIVFATMPFAFEGKRRMAQAEETLAILERYADAVICFENDKMADAVSPKAPIQEAFAVADQTLSQSVRAVAMLALRRSLIHAGFDAVATAVRANNPRSLFGFGEADGDNRAFVALERALKNPLMDRGRMLATARNVLIHIAGGPSLTLNEVQMLMDEFRRHINEDTHVLFSAAVDSRLDRYLTVTILSALDVTQRSEIAAPRIEMPSISRAMISLPPALVQPATDTLIAELAFEPGPGIEEAAPEETALAEALAEDLFVLETEEPTEAHQAEEAPAEVQGREEDFEEEIVEELEEVEEPEVVEEQEEAVEEEEEEIPAAVRNVFRASTNAAAAARPRAGELPPSLPAHNHDLPGRGRFEKSEPTVVDGQDLDVPTFLRRTMRPR